MRKTLKSRSPNSCLTQPSIADWRSYYRYDVEAFARFFFPHHLDNDFTDFHRIVFVQYLRSVFPEFTERLSPKHLMRKRKGVRELYLAPRGNAKSTVASFICCAHAICYRLERYITIFSSTQEQATQRVRNVKAEFEANERLKAFFPVHWGSKAERSFDVNGVRMEGHGIQTARRGISWGPERPTRIILDDIEEDEGVLNAQTRQKVKDRFNRVIEELGSPITNLLVLGTMIHPECLLADLQANRPDFRSFFFRSIEKEPEDKELWCEYERIAFNPEDEQRLTTAKEFYDKNRKAMDKGAEVLWPDREPLVDLMTKRMFIGKFAFDAEKQNSPRNPDTQVFNAEEYSYFSVAGDIITVEGTGEKLNWTEMIRFAFLDPAVGLQGSESKTKKGARDWSSLCQIAVDKRGRIFVLDCWLCKHNPAVMLAGVVDRFLVWGGELGFETNGFQSVLLLPFQGIVKQYQVEGRLKGAVPHWTFNQNANKTARIMRLEPLLKHGWALLNRGLPTEFMDQLNAFPTGSHDDGPDSLEGAISLATLRGALRFPGTKEND